MKSNKIIRLVVLLLLGGALFVVDSCDREDEFEVNQMLSRLSEYNIYVGNQADLIPSADYQVYELSSTLFTDFAEKQRLIKVLPGTAVSAVSDGLLEFPEGTIIVKTFFYYLDRRDTMKGKNIIESRVLVKQGSKWKLGVYKWNRDGSDAFLVTAGQDQLVSWIDGDGNAKVISYHMPNNSECRTCHESNANVMPIGPKVRNLNFIVSRNNTSINQLVHLQNVGTMRPAAPASFSSMPDYNDSLIPDEQRVRAYFDINCAHCHSAGGFASDRGPRFGYENSLQSSGIVDQRGEIIQRLEEGEMPRLGTTVLDTKNIELIKSYLNSL